MSRISLDVPVGQLCVEHPSLTRVFERFGIDYCCGGKMQLGTAIFKRKLAPEAVVEAIEQALAKAGATPDLSWKDASLAALVEHLIGTHHAFLRAEMPRVGKLAAKVARVHGVAHPELVEVERIFGHFESEMSPHMEKEERILFPAIVALEKGQGGFPIGGPIAVMEKEHEDAAIDLARLRELTDEYRLPGDACNSYRALFSGLQDIESDTFRHVHKENSVLFPRAIALVEQNEVAPQVR